MYKCLLLRWRDYWAWRKVGYLGHCRPIHFVMHQMWRLRWAEEYRDSRITLQRINLDAAISWSASFLCDQITSTPRSGYSNPCLFLRANAHWKQFGQVIIHQYSWNGSNAGTFACELTYGIKNAKEDSRNWYLFLETTRRRWIESLPFGMPVSQEAQDRAVSIGFPIP